MSDPKGLIDLAAYYCYPFQAGLTQNIKSFELRAHHCKSIIILGDKALETVESLVLFYDVVESSRLYEIITAHSLYFLQLRAHIKQAALCLCLIMKDLP